MIIAKGEIDVINLRMSTFEVIEINIFKGTDRKTCRFDLISDSINQPWIEEQLQYVTQTGLRI